MTMGWSEDTCRVRARSPAQDPVHRLRYLLLSFLEHVPVGIRRQRDRAVTEEVLDVFECEALGEQERRRGMTEVVEAAVGEAGSSKGSLVGPGDRGCLDGRADGRGEDMARVQPA